MNSKYIKLSQYAKIMGVTYRTAASYFHRGIISGYKDTITGTIFINNPNLQEKDNKEIKVVLYARVSSIMNKDSLNGQIERLKIYALAKGYTIIDEVKEIASGLNDNRKYLNKILKSNDWDVLLVEHKDRLTRFGFGYFQYLEKLNQRIEVANKTEEKDKQQEILEDFVSIITSFCGRLYGSKRKEKTMKIIEELNKE